MFKQFFQLIQNQLDCRIRKLQTDGGGEYSSKYFLGFLASHGIIWQVTAPYSPVSNGIAERTNRGILDPVRCMLKQSGLPTSFWAEAARVAVYIKNHATHRSIGKTPYEALYGRKPEIGHLRSFGCIAYTHVPEAKHTKLDDRATRYIFIGYTETPSIWRVCDPVTKRVYTSRDIKFDEAVFYKDIQQESVGVQVQLFPPREFPEPDWMDTGPVGQNIPIDIDREEAAPAVPPDAVERVARRRRRGDDLSIDMNWQPVGGEGITRSCRHRSQQKEAHCIVHSILYAVPGPSNYREAVAAEDSDYWQEAIASEMNALQHHDVLELIIGDLPPSCQIVDSK